MIDWLSESNLTSDLNWKNKIIQILKRHFWTIMSSAIGGFLYYCGLLYYKHMNMLNTEGRYRTDSIPIWDIPSSIFPILKGSLVRMFYGVYSPDISTNNFIFALLLSLLILYIIIKIFARPECILKKIVKAVFVLFLFAAVLLCSNAVTILTLKSRGVGFSAGNDWFGALYVNVLIIVLFLREVRIKFLKNIMVIVCCFILYTDVIFNLEVQKSWKFRWDAEMMQMNRLIYSIQTAENFDRKKVYKYFDIGHFPSINPYSAREGYVTETPIVYDVSPYSVYSFMGLSDTSDYPKASFDDIVKLEQELKKAQVWPAKGSIIIKDDILCIVFEQKKLDEILKKIEEEKTKKLKTASLES
ncbi:MAG: hypothetical protein LBH29_05660 [Elusimicrobiota bacterium]|jgi:hypothetical protein|nr:hypothetical protein [Elusimicrobiota bacterium]